MTSPTAPPTCAFHPNRPALVQCQRCNRRVCPQCQVPAAVGVQCPACVRQAKQHTPVPRSVFGAPLGQGMPVITVGIIALCVVAYVADLVSGNRLTVDLGFAPWYAKAEPWRFVTGAFMHASFLHLFLNMYCLWVVGSFLEQVLGRARYTVLYFTGALGGHMLVLAWARLVDNAGFGGITVGASGAVFGLFGAALVLGRRLGRDMTGIATVVGINLVLSFVMVRVSWQGHVGGLLSGSAMAAVYAFAPQGKRVVWAWAGGIGAAVLLLAAWLALTTTLPG